jgi:hypothetical protein
VRRCAQEVIMFRYIGLPVKGVKKNAQGEPVAFT